MGGSEVWYVHIPAGGALTGVSLVALVPPVLS